MGLISGYILGWFGHRRHTRQQSKDRRADLKSVTAKWRYEVDNCGNGEAIAKDFAARMPAIIQQADRVRSDLSDTDIRTLDKLFDEIRLRGANASEMSADNKDMIGRAGLTKALDALIEFLNR